MAAVTMSPPPDVEIKLENKATLTPPASEHTDKHDDSGSELSDLEPDGDTYGEILPDHYYGGGKIPVFKPTMDEFRSFKSFISKIDKYGMKSGIVKVIPPQEWRDALPRLDEQVKTIKVKNPITQEFHGSHGTYTQANIEKQRSYNLPQWKALTEESNHQPPAKRGERRRNQTERVTRGGQARAAKTTVAASTNGKKRGVGRPRVRPLPTETHKLEEDGDGDEEPVDQIQVPPTPTSPATKPTKLKKEALSDEDETSSPKPKGRQPKSVSSRRKHNRQDQGNVVDEEAFKDFDYRVYNQDEWTPERCQELETAYWKGLTFNNPMYGADMPGSLFDDSTESWNVAKLENLLDVLGQKVPGVNTAYLYLGMWKATFAWHLEDVDLYSINYIHFGAPKQWYSISQEDARRFEAAMRNVWPNDSKNCDQFLRHKTYLISPQLLQSQYNIKVNRLVHHEGEFVITFPYGYHSGYNLGYNCAESVNFATEAWLDYGKVAKKCNCEADSVWVDVHDIERKLRGEPTPEYYEETDDEDEEEEDDEGPTDLPTPPGSDKGKPKARTYKRKRDAVDGGNKPKIKRLRIKIKAPTKEPCVLCPNDYAFEPLLSTDNGQKAHRKCGLFTPETYFSEDKGVETICDVNQIDKARLELKCNYCRSKRGAKFQCSSRKCARAYHATCAAAAGVQVDIGIIPVYGDDGTEYTDTGIDFRCRFHRIKRSKDVNGDTLEEDSFIRKRGPKVPVGEIVQVQYLQGDIFAGLVLENRKSEQTLLIEVLPKGDKVEVEYKWVHFFDPANSQLPIPSENAKPLPAHLSRKSQTTTEDPSNDVPKPDDPFCDPNSQQKWQEFHTTKLPPNPTQVKVDISKPKTLWFYLGKTSTEAKAQYTGDINVQQNDQSANFLESVKPAVHVYIPPAKRMSYPASFPTGNYTQKANSVNRPIPVQQYQPPPNCAPMASKPQERPYNGKYAIKDTYPPRVGYHVDAQALHNQRTFLKTATIPPAYPYPPFQRAPIPFTQQNSTGSQAPMPYVAQRAPTTPSNQGVGGYKSVSHQIANQGDLSLTYQWTQEPHQPQQQSKVLPQPQAPVANMMIRNSNISHAPNPFGPNPSSRPCSSSSQKPIPAILNGPRSRSDSVEALSKYPYLYQAALKRPVVYQSPYPPEGGFSPAYQPKAEGDHQEPRKAPGLSEEFLMKRTPSQQEHCKNHVRQLSVDKINRQQQTRQDTQQRPIMPPPHQVQRQHNYLPPLRTTYQQSPYQHSYSHSLPQVISADQLHNHNPSPHSYSPQQHPFQGSQHHPQFYHPQSPSGLQFQSPQDFQQHMQRDGQQPQWPRTTSYENFLSRLHNSASESHSHAAGVENREGTGLLRQGMRGGGGEMLPMMGDRGF
ncbi:MAG: hypothetical protein MMC33_006102 [Icmadophila ericetorum]|nr:hypothetical protein [Icmadophila ericetorum]